MRRRNLSALLGFLTLGMMGSQTSNHSIIDPGPIDPQEKYYEPKNSISPKAFGENYRPKKGRKTKKTNKRIH